MMLEEKDSFCQTLHEWIKALAAFNKNSSRHVADDLSVNVSMSVRMIPEQSDVPLGDFYLVRERIPGSNVQKYIVAIVQRRNAQSMKMEVCLLGQLIMQRDSQDVASTHAP